MGGKKGKGEKKEERRGGGFTLKSRTTSATRANQPASQPFTKRQGGLSSHPCIHTCMCRLFLSLMLVKIPRLDMVDAVWVFVVCRST